MGAKQGDGVTVDEAMGSGSSQRDSNTISQIADKDIEVNAEKISQKNAFQGKVKSMKPLNQHNMDEKMATSVKYAQQNNESNSNNERPAANVQQHKQHNRNL